MEPFIHVLNLVVFAVPTTPRQATFNIWNKCCYFACQTPYLSLSFLDMTE